MILPARWTIMCGATARTTLNTPPTLVSSTSFTSSSSIAASWLSRIIPALFTRMSIRPQRSATRSTAAAQAAESRMSTCSAEILPVVSGAGFARLDHVGRGGGIVAIEERHVHAFRRQQQDDGAADAAAAAGHDGHLARESGIHRHRGHQPEIAKPPSTTSVWPLIMPASGRHSRNTAPATSCGVSTGPAGVRCEKLASNSSRLGK